MDKNLSVIRFLAIIEFKKEIVLKISKNRASNGKRKGSKLWSIDY